VKFNDLVKLYESESEQTGPPYIAKGQFTTTYYADPLHKIIHRDEKDPETGAPLPAYIHDLNMMKTWWINGKRHREDGPAIDNGYTRQWWLNGERVKVKNQDEFDDCMKRRQIKQDVQGHKNNRIDPGMLEDYL
jgi:hypothetical protein